MPSLKALYEECVYVFVHAYKCMGLGVERVYVWAHTFLCMEEKEWSLTKSSRLWTGFISEDWDEAQHIFDMKANSTTSTSHYSWQVLKLLGIMNLDFQTEKKFNSTKHKIIRNRQSIDFALEYNKRFSRNKLATRYIGPWNNNLNICFRYSWRQKLDIFTC